MSVRTVLHDPAIELVALNPQVLLGLSKVGDQITRDVESSTSGSKRLAPFARFMSKERSEKGLRIGTSWGPAVPIEYGTVRTPAKRILLGAAEKNGTVEFR